jgi:hypothetical protein
MAGLRAVHAQDRNDVAALRRLLGDTDVDAYDVEHHGLAWWYPQLKHWPTVRSVGGGRAGGASGPLPLNVEALDFLSEKYWVGTRSIDRCSDDELDDPDNYRAGFEPTLLELERSVRRALGQAEPPHHHPPADLLDELPAVRAALDYLREFAPEIVADELLHELVREEAIRLIVRARGMLHGARWSAGRGPCMNCHQPWSVVSDEDRAVCINPMCRRPNGERYCWTYLAQRDVDEALVHDVAPTSPWLEPGWLDVPEPDVRGRGQVSDEQLSRWAHTG